MIVIAARSDDPHALRVAEMLRSKHSLEPVILDTSQVPTSMGLSGTFDQKGWSASLFGHSASGEQAWSMSLGDATAFWWRRPQGMEIDSRITDPESRRFAYDECVSGLYGLLQCCGGLWVNDFAADQAAEYKTRQLQLAARVGFEIPDSLVTTSPEQALDFLGRNEGGVVYKAFNQHGLVWRPTRILGQAELDLLDHIRHAPVIFQTFVPGVEDVRVTVIGERLFATAFDLSEARTVDHRVDLTTLPCAPHQLPASVEATIRSFMELLQLEYGAVDLRRTPEGDYVFFEVNPAGEFVYLEDRTGQPLSAAMADHLAAGLTTYGPSRSGGKENR